MLKRYVEKICPSVGENDISIAICNLPEDYKLPIRLYFENDMTRNQIAKELGWSISKVNQKITRGVTLLKMQLNPSYFKEASVIMERTSHRLLLR